jgi:hypothetical protein
LSPPSDLEPPSGSSLGSGPERAAKDIICRLNILSTWQTKENRLLSSLFNHR